MTRIQVRNRYRAAERVRGALVEVDPVEVGPPVLSGTTNQWGNVDIDLAVLMNAVHTLRVTAPETTADVVGPGTAAMPVPPDRIFRTLDVSIRTSLGTVTAVNLLPQQRPNGSAALGGGASVLVDLQPVWMRSPNHGSRGGTNITKVIVHHTATATAWAALGTFLLGGTSAHYVVDREGLIVKMVQDSRRAHHAGVARWRGSAAVNSSSIGIEIVHRREDGNYTDAQYQSVIGLLNRLTAAHATIEIRNIVGHSDVATNASGRLGRKSSDPGSVFHWQRLEDHVLGLIPGVIQAVPANVYGGFFQQVPNGSFRRGDNDAADIFGGNHRPAVVGDPVQEIQNDLVTIGYSVGSAGPDGDFGQGTHWAVQMFQEHFFAGGRGGAPSGRVDRATAVMIKRVVNGL